MRRFALIAIAALASILPAFSAAAQADISEEIARTTQALEEIRADIDDGVVNAPQLEDRLRKLRISSRARVDPIARAIAKAESDLSLLGDPPGEGAPAEPEPLANQRASLNERIAGLRAQEVQITSNIDEATELLTKLSTRRLGQLYRDAVERGETLLSPDLWRNAARSASGLGAAIGEYFADWANRKQGEGGLLIPLLLIGAAVILSMLMFGPVNHWVVSKFTNRIERFEPTPDRRVVAAGLKMLARAVPGIVGGMIVFETLKAVGVIAPEGSQVAQSAWFVLVGFLLVTGFVNGLFNAKNPNWRVAPLLEEQGRKAGTYVVGIVSIFGVKVILEAVANAEDAAPELIQVFDGISAVIIGVLLFLLSRRGLWRGAPAEPEEKPASENSGDEQKEQSGDRWGLFRRVVRVIAVLTIAAPFFGYIAFAEFITARLYALALILAILWFARSLMREIAGSALRRLRHSTSPEEGEDEKKNFDRFWINAAIDVLFFLMLIPAVLVLIGARWAAIADLGAQAFFGFRIGGVQIPSLASVLISIGAFIAALTVTRLVQRGLARGPFAHSRLDVGVQNSLTTLVGYAGLVLALLIAIMSLGFNLGNLAIIAGALSVGIGFGLQSIVNNFVSGLILLFERPIKVGDWIITASGEGTVKKISVRSTEIETFDRSSIIIPNSELISQSVTNWTHKDKIGRVTVPVGVSYGSDPEQVKEILLKCARDHPLIVRYPEPFVVWQDFGASSLDFEIRAYLRDITSGMTVRTELRFAIFKAFKEAGIEIPFPQSDLHIRTIPKTEPSKRNGKGKKKPEGDGGSDSESELAEDD